MSKQVTKQFTDVMDGVNNLIKKIIIGVIVIGVVMMVLMEMMR